MAAGDVKTEYGTSTDLAVTALVDMASSATWVAGWSSDPIDNTTNKYLDYLISGTITALHDPASTAGEIRVYVVAMISDTAWPDTITATDAVDTWTTAAIRDGAAKLGASISNATTVHITYPFGPFSVAALFGGVCPPKFCIFIAHNMTQTLDHDGQVVTYQGIYNTVAAA
jgi:hypothetical protein